MEKELTSAEKARKTKLSNKTVEELVEVIFRKDNTEKRLQRLNKCLKANIVGLEAKCERLNNELGQKEDEIVSLQRQIDYERESHCIDVDAYLDYKIKVRNNIKYSCVIAIIIAIAYIIIRNLF